LLRKKIKSKNKGEEINTPHQILPYITLILDGILEGDDSNRI
jgi:hypothetical protein